MDEETMRSAAAVGAITDDLARVIDAGCPGALRARGIIEGGVGAVAVGGSRARCL
jgi:hypothetical protein